MSEDEIDSLVAYFVKFTAARRQDDFGIYMDSRTCVYGDGGAYIDEYCKEYGKSNCLNMLAMIFSLEEESKHYTRDWNIEFPKEIYIPIPEKKVYHFKKNWEFTYGKYKGKTVEYVINENPLYLQWTLKKMDWFLLDEECTKLLEEKLKGIDLEFNG